MLRILFRISPILGLLSASSRTAVVLLDIILCAMDGPPGTHLTQSAFFVLESHGNNWRKVDQTPAVTTECQVVSTYESDRLLGGRSPACPQLLEPQYPSAPQPPQTSNPFTLYPRPARHAKQLTHFGLRVYATGTRQVFCEAKSRLANSFFGILYSIKFL